MIALTPGALRGALLAHRVEFHADAVDALGDFAPVRFELRFTLAAPHANAAGLTRQVTPVTREPRQQMFELRELHLQLALPRACALREDVEDERGAVENLALENLLQIARLRPAQIVVEDDRVHVQLFALFGKLHRLAAADEGAGHGRLQLLPARAGHDAAGRLREFGEFFERLLDFRGRAALEFKPDEEDPLGPPVGCVDECFQWVLNLVAGR